MARELRSVSEVVTAHRQLEGGGFPVRRPFPTAGRDMVDPFLLLDEMGPVDWGPGEAIGAPDHPHRGFETVTYVLEGRMEHRDSGGHHGVIGPGDVQWMTAGAGVVHSELPEESFLRTGGRMHGFQLWVNLPRSDKMMQPRYQEIPAERIPSVRSEDGKVTVRVIAGEAMGASAVIDTRTPIFYLHYSLEPGGRVEQPAGKEYNVFLYAYDGSVRIGDQAVTAGHAVIFDDGGERVAFENAGDEPAGALLIGGVPLREPVARYGPFVMNYKAEILEAIEDFQSGRMGKIE